MGTLNVKPQGDPTTEVLGAGAIYVGGNADPESWGDTPPTVFGTATKGGSVFNDNAEFRERTADSDYFPVKGARDLTFMRPQLTIQSLSIKAVDLVKAYGGLESVTGTLYNAMTRTLDLSSSYQENVWWIGRDRAGDDLIIWLGNALGDGPITITGAKDEEIVIPVIFTAHADPATFDPDDSDTYPYKIYREIAV